MIEICELKYAKVYLNRDQKHKGRCIVAHKEHHTEYFQMSEEENAGFFAEVSGVAKAIWEVFHPDKINYATFGDLVPHVHVHIVPKYRNGLNWGSPFDDTLPKELLDDSEYEEIAQQLRDKIQGTTI